MLGDIQYWQVLRLCWCAHVFLHKDELSVPASKNGDMIPFSDYMFTVTSVYLCDQTDCNTDDMFWLYLRNIADPSTGAFLEIAEFSIVTQIWGIRLLLGFYWDGKVSPVWVYDSGQNDSTDIYIVADSDKYMKSTAELLSFRRNLVKIDNFRRKLVKLRRTPFLKMCHFRRKLVKLRRTSYLKMCHVRRQLVKICEIL